MDTWTPNSQTTQYFLSLANAGMAVQRVVRCVTRVATTLRRSVEPAL